MQINKTSVENFIANTASTIKKMLNADDVYVKKSVIVAALNNVLIKLVKGEDFITTANNQQNFEYNEAGDLLNIAFNMFTAGDKKEGLKAVITAFKSEDCGTLMDVIAKVNKEAKGSNNPKEDKEIENVLASLNDDDDTDDAMDDNSEDYDDDDDVDGDDNNNDDDDDLDDDDLDDDDLDDSGVDDDDFDDEDDDDDEEDDENGDYSTSTASSNDTIQNLIKKVKKSQPEVLAAVNKLFNDGRVNEAKKLLIATANKAA